MQTIIVILIVAAAAAYLIRRFIKHGVGNSCGCSCTSCSPEKSECYDRKDSAGKQH